MYFNILIFAFGFSIWDFKKEVHLVSQDPLWSLACKSFEVAAPSCFPASHHCHPLCSPVSVTCVTGPRAQLSPLPASSLSHQSDRDLSLIIMPKQASLGSTPRLTSVVATPHASGMLHFSVRTTTKKNLLLNATHNPKWWLLSLYALCSPQAWKASIQTASLTGSSDCFDWHKPGHWYAYPSPQGLLQGAEVAR